MSEGRRHAPLPLRPPGRQPHLHQHWGRAYPTEDLNRAFNDLLTDQEGLLGSIADNAPGWLDQGEALWSDRPDKTGTAALETDAWVRELVAAAPGVLFVFFGRERLGWDRRFPRDWGGLLADQHLLGGLAEPDAQRLLAAIPIPDPAVRRAIILGAMADEGAAATQTSGAHPFYLDLAVETWLDLTADGGTPAPDDFGAESGLPPDEWERLLVAAARGFSRRRAAHGGRGL